MSHIAFYNWQKNCDEIGKHIHANKIMQQLYLVTMRNSENEETSSRERFQTSYISTTSDEIILFIISTSKDAILGFYAELFNTSGIYYNINYSMWFETLLS